MQQVSHLLDGDVRPSETLFRIVLPSCVCCAPRCLPPLLSAGGPQAALSLGISLKPLPCRSTKKMLLACPQLPHTLLCSLFQIDNKGNHLLVHEESSINVPAIAAAHVIKRYIAQAADELSFEVNN